MTYLKTEALGLVNAMHSANRLTENEYNTLFDALDEIETLRDRDQQLESLWGQLADVPVDPDTEKLEDDWIIFPMGTDKEDIWHWFDKRHSKGVAYLLYHDGIDRTDQFSKMVYLKQFCIECESQTCQYNHGGECRFAMVHERKPRITDEDGCIDFDYQEGEC